VNLKSPAQKAVAKKQPEQQILEWKESRQVCRLALQVLDCAFAVTLLDSSARMAWYTMWSFNTRNVSSGKSSP
jgi:hypothetical protein